MRHIAVKKNFFPWALVVLDGIYYWKRDIKIDNGMEFGSCGTLGLVRHIHQNNYQHHHIFVMECPCIRRFLDDMMIIWAVIIHHQNDQTDMNIVIENVEHV
jgi:hypothetical protein